MSLNKENRDFIDSGNGRVHNCFSEEHGHLSCRMIHGGRNIWLCYFRMMKERTP